LGHSVLDYDVTLAPTAGSWRLG